MRIFWTTVLIVGGFVLQAVSYLKWAAPLGVPARAADSNPVVLFAAGFFALGVILVFVAALVYELIPGERN